MYAIKVSLNSTSDDKFHKVYLAVCINLKQEHHSSIVVDYK